MKTVVVSLLVAAVAWATIDYVWRAKVTDGVTVTFSVNAEIDLDGVRYSGSSVWEMAHWYMWFPTTAGPNFKVRGEAIPLEGGPRNLFLIRKGVGGGVRG